MNSDSNSFRTFLIIVCIAVAIVAGVVGASLANSHKSFSQRCSNDNGAVFSRTVNGQTQNVCIVNGQQIQP